MLPPKPFAYECPECGYRRVVKPKSDVANPKELINICPKCKATMKRGELKLWERIF